MTKQILIYPIILIFFAVFPVYNLLLVIIEDSVTNKINKLRNMQIAVKNIICLLY